MNFKNKYDSIAEIVKSRAARDGGRTAFIYLEDSGQSENVLTYEELDNRAKRIASFLLAHREPGDRILLLLPSGLEYICAFIACLYAGMIAIPLYPPRKKEKHSRVAAIIKNSGATMAFGSGESYENVLDVLSNHHNFSPVNIVKVEALYTENINEAFPVVGKDKLAFLQYTSGSTGDPKGVMIAHNNIMANVLTLTEATNCTEKDVFVNWLPLFHDLGLVTTILWPIYIGAVSVIMAPAEFARKPLCWLRAISKYKGTTCGGPNFSFDLCCDVITPDQLSELDFSQWRIAYNAGEPVRAETLDRFSHCFSPAKFSKTAFYPSYGMAEATVHIAAGVSSQKPIKRTLDRNALQKNQLLEIKSAHNSKDITTIIGCGKAQKNHELKIVDPETCEDLKEGNIGEIWFKGPSVGLGYWEREKESEVFAGYIQNQQHEGPYLRTGDLGFMEDGELFITGRIKDVIIIRGMNYYPNDIELTVRKTFPDELYLGYGAAFSVVDNDQEKLVVIQEIRRPRDFDTIVNELDTNIRKAVAYEHGVDVYAVVLTRIAKLPITSSGKIKRRASKQAYLEKELNLLYESTYDPSDNQHKVEKLNRASLLALSDDERNRALSEYLFAHISSVIAIPSEQLKFDLPIIQYGLNSLKAVQLQHQIESQLSVSLNIQDLLLDCSIKKLHQLILKSLCKESVQGHLEQSLDKITVNPKDVSYGQRALWVIHQQEKKSTAYNISKAIQFTSTVDINCLKQAFHILLERHSALRTNFINIDGQPVAKSSDKVADFISQVDSRLWSVEQIKDQIIKESYLPFNLENDPLFRIVIYTLKNNKILLLCVAHHIIVDFRSLDLMFAEIGELYSGIKKNPEFSLPSERWDYYHYIAWQKHYLNEAKLGWLLKYWQNELSGELPLLNLPTDFQRGDTQTFAGATVTVELEISLSQKISQLGRDAGVTPYVILLGAFQLLLHRYCGQDDIVVGTPVLGRSRAEFANIIGYFVNPIAIRSSLKKELMVEDFLHMISHKVVAGIEHQDLPFELLVKNLVDNRDSGRSPVFQVMFVYQNSTLDESQGINSLILNQQDSLVNFGELQAQAVQLDEKAVQFDLVLEIAETRQGFGAVLKYNTDLYQANTAQQMLSHYQQLLNSMISGIAEPVHQLQIMSREEINRIVYSWNETTVPYNSSKCMHQLFEEQVNRTPHQIAIETTDANNISYHKLNEKANQFAWQLKELGVGPEVAVALCLERSTEMIVALLGILKVGGFYVPLECHWPNERISGILDIAHCKYIVTSTKYLDKVRQLADQKNYLKHIFCPDMYKATQAVNNYKIWTRNEIEEFSKESLGLSLQSSNTAYVIFTSGSTGVPKGVVIKHQSVINLIEWVNGTYNVNITDKLLWVTSICFDLSVYDVFGILATGATVYLATEQETKDPEIIVDLLDNKAITFWDTAPAAFLQLVPLLKDRSIKSVNEHLRLIFWSGDWIPLSLPDHARSAFPNVKVISLGGATEATIWSNYFPVNNIDPSWKSIPYGKPIQNSKYYILDNHLNPCPVTVPGDLYIGGECLATEYLGDSSQTANRFLENPFSDGISERIYKTGDLARFKHDGNIEFLGRADFQVKINGFRIELGDIESALIKHQFVEEVVVLVREDKEYNKQLVAYIIEKNASSLHKNAIKDFAQKSLPVYMVPQFYVFLESFPVTTNGKLDRKALMSTEILASDEQTYIAPRNALERTLCDIWSGLLKVEKIGINHNFYTLGGDSILATQMVARAKQHGIYLKLQQLLKYQCIGEIVEHLEQISMNISQEQSKGGFQLLPVQLQFLYNDLTDQHYFNQSVLLTAPADLAVETLNKICTELISRHDALRLRFSRKKEYWQSSFEPFSSVMSEQMMAVEDISDLDNDRQSEALSMLAKKYKASLNLNNGPIGRIIYFKGKHQNHLLLSFHHLVVDGVSWRILVRDLNIIYSQLGAKAPSSVTVKLGRKTTPYQQWGKFLNTYAKTIDLKQEKNFWLEQLQIPQEAFPVTYTNIADLKNKYTRQMSVTLEQSSTKSLITSCLQRYHAEIIELLLTGLLRGFQQWRNQHTLCIDIENHGRATLNENMDLTETVGWFTSIFPLTLKTNPSSSLFDLIRDVKQLNRKIPNNGIGFGLLTDIAQDKELVELWANREKHIIVNYLGQVDQLTDENDAFQYIPLLASDDVSEERLRAYTVGFNILIKNSCLEILVDYHTSQYDEPVIAELLHKFKAALEELSRPENLNHKQLSQLLSPADIPLCNIEKNRLQDLINHVQGLTDVSIVDIYPLAPTQQGIMFHSLLLQSAEAYFEQIVCRFKNGFRPDVWKKAWEIVVDKYEIFRTGFYSYADLEPVQIVFDHVDLPWKEKDWRHLSDQEQIAKLDKELHIHRSKGFQFELAPLIQLFVYRIDDEVYDFVWNFHHVILDGWSLSVVINELVTLYQEIERREIRERNNTYQYKDYIAWLQNIDKEQYEEYWKGYLSGFDSIVYLNIDKQYREQKESLPSQRQKRCVNNFSIEESDKINAFLRETKTTLNALIQLAFSILIAAYSKRQDIVFGETVAGRPAELNGIETMVGLFIHTLPVRIQLHKDEPLSVLLEKIRLDSVQREECAYISLSQIQKLSDLSRGTLFNILLNVENYPIDKDVIEKSGLLKVNDIKLMDDNGNPLTLTIVPKDRIHAFFAYDESRFDDVDIKNFLEDFKLLITTVVLHQKQNTGFLFETLENNIQNRLITAKNRFKHSRSFRSRKNLSETNTKQSLNTEVN